MFSSGVTSDDIFNEQTCAQDLRSKIRHTFNTGFMSDINFIVGQAEKQKTFPAHRFILGISSPVFHAMFFGTLAEIGRKVSIPDAEPDAFCEFLRYLYTEECGITGENVMNILYLSTKYIVPALMKKCVRFLRKKVTPESAFEVLTQAIHFCADDLEENCWEVIDCDCAQAVKSEAFLKIEHSLLCHLLSRDSLNAKEIDLFTAVLKWAQFQCQEQGIEGTVDNRRKVLGKAIDLIRFPTMALEEFASTVVHESKILHEQDIIKTFLLFSGHKRSEEVPKFSCKPRRHTAGKTRITRFSPQKIIRPKRAGKGWCYVNNTLDALCFKVSQPVFIHGVRAFGDDDRSVYRLKVNILQGNRELSSNAGEFKSEPEDEDGHKPTGFDIMFPEPVRVDAGVVYTLTGSFSGPQSFYGQGGEKVIVQDEVEFMFCSSEQSNNGTSVFHGQFPQIIFSKV